MGARLIAPERNRCSDRLNLMSQGRPLATMLEDVRALTAEDVPTMVASEKERTERERFEPEFFPKAEQGATTQEAYFKWQLTQPNVIAVVHEAESGIDGFAIASLITAPPVYMPGGPTALIVGSCG